MTDKLFQAAMRNTQDKTGMTQAELMQHHNRLRELSRPFGDRIFSGILDQLSNSQDAHPECPAYIAADLAEGIGLIMARLLYAQDEKTRMLCKARLLDRVEKGWDSYHHQVQSDDG